MIDVKFVVCILSFKRKKQTKKKYTLAQSFIRTIKSEMRKWKCLVKIGSVDLMYFDGIYCFWIEQLWLRACKSHWRIFGSGCSKLQCWFIYGINVHHSQNTNQINTQFRMIRVVLQKFVFNSATCEFYFVSACVWITNDIICRLSNLIRHMTKLRQKILHDLTWLTEKSVRMKPNLFPQHPYFTRFSTHLQI